MATVAVIKEDIAVKKRYCANCNAPAPKGASFCASCGNSLTAPNAIIERNPLKEKLAKRPDFKFKGPLSLVAKILITVVIVIIIAALATHFTIKSYVSPENRVTELAHALTNIDTEEFFDMLEIPKNVRYDEKTYMKFLHRVASAIEDDNDEDDDDDDDIDLRAELTEVAKDVYRTGVAQSFYLPETSFNERIELLRVAPDKKYNYNTVKFIPITYKAILETDMRGITIKLLGETYTLNARDIELGQFLPGDYEYDITLHDEYIEGDYWKVFRVPNSIAGAKLDYMAWHQAARITSNFPNSELYIDDETTGKTVKEFGSLGPILKNTLKVFAERENDKGELVKTPVKYLRAGEEAQLTFPDTNEKDSPFASSGKLSRGGAESFIKRYRRVYERALNTNNFDAVASYLLPNSPAEKELQSYFATPRDISKFKYSFIETTSQHSEIKGDSAFVTMYEEFYYTDANDVSTLTKQKRLYELRMDDTNNYSIYSITNVQ